MQIRIPCSIFHQTGAEGLKDGSGEWISGGTAAIEFAKILENSLYFSLLQGIWKRTVRSGLDPPPDSPSCREIRLHYRENRNRLPQFGDSCARTGPEKVSRRTPLTTFAAFFSGGQTLSPVSTTASGEIAC